MIMIDQKVFGLKHDYHMITNFTQKSSDLDLYAVDPHGFVKV